MPGFIRKIKEEAKAVEAAIDNELTVLEGAPGGYDPLSEEDQDETGDAPTDKDATDADKGGAAPPNDDTEGGGTPVEGS
ncbi:hypothetical protein ACLQ3C_07020 [Gordonia sp. DT30]|uniref:hypothetical protein n=1 Tax=unclassified Gordonia (in: high G+C Gram-positive bacteria) TaxID=2657482 RepID=UPI003CEAD317